MKLYKLAKIVKEDIDKEPVAPTPLTTEEKRAILKMVAEYNKIGETISHNKHLKEVTHKMGKMIEGASRLALQEADDWFDRGMVEKSMKTIQDNYKIFEKVANEIASLQQKLEAAYDAIGTGLNQYYDIED